MANACRVYCQENKKKSPRRKTIEPRQDDGYCVSTDPAPWTLCIAHRHKGFRRITAAFIRAGRGRLRFSMGKSAPAFGKKRSGIKRGIASAAWCVDRGGGGGWEDKYSKSKWFSISFGRPSANAKNGGGGFTMV